MNQAKAEMYDVYLLERYFHQMTRCGRGSTTRGQAMLKEKQARLVVTFHNTLRKLIAVHELTTEALVESMLPVMMRYCGEVFDDCKAEIVHEFGWFRRHLVPRRFAGARLRCLRYEKRRWCVAAVFYAELHEDKRRPERRQFEEIIFKDCFVLHPLEIDRLERVHRSIRRSIRRRYHCCHRECVICKEQIKLGPAADEAVYLPCTDKHQLHLECARGWLKINASCPECRKPCYVK